MPRWIWSWRLALLFSGCVSQSQMPAPVYAPSPLIAAPIVPQNKSEPPSSLKLKLALDDPGDLKVQQGDQVSKGQILGDRTSTRKHLEQQRQVIHFKLEHLNANAGKVSKSDSYAVEKSRIRQAQLRMQQAKGEIAEFKTNSPWTDYAWASLPLYKESTQVSQLVIKVQDAEAELDLAVAQLQAAREKNPVHVDRQDQELLMSQLRDIEMRLDGVGVVRSPYAGSVKKIKWIGQIDQELLVELTISVDETQPK